MRTLVILLALSLGAAAFGQQVYEGFEDPAMDARYRDLIHTLRCMKCQNQSIAESPVDQAGDIRNLVREMMIEGKSDGEIRDYLISRYGDFVSYKPPLKPSTILLWVGPFLLVAGGAFVFARIIRTHLNQPLDEDLG